MDNFFKVSDNKRSECNLLKNIKARAILVDMEEGVIAEALKGHLKDFFDRKQLVTDVSGSGNNWAVGNKYYGTKYQNHLTELFRTEAEECDSLECFFLLHSMGGGTGSGLGTAVLEFLYDEFPKIPKFAFSAFPSIQDDVITSPYNTVLANRQLINFADCVIPFQNKALVDICNRNSKQKRFQPAVNFIGSKFGLKSSLYAINPSLNPQKARPFDEMNDIVANVILNLTCSSRFPGSLNVDINEIVMNMSPYPRLHYLLPSASPLLPSYDNCKIDQMFNEAFSTGHQLFQCSLTKGILLTSALLCRGQISMSDVQYNIERLKNSLKFVPWNEDGWKIGLCGLPNVCHPFSLLVLSNSSAITKPFQRLKENFLKMFRKKAHLHHFLEVEGMEVDTFKEAFNDLEILIDEYSGLELLMEMPEQPRLKVKL